VNGGGTTTDGLLDQINSPFGAASTTAIQTGQIEVYACNCVWASFLLLSTLNLLAIGIYGLVLKYKTLAPDLLGM
jgi:hypothetical protein